MTDPVVVLLRCGQEAAGSQVDGAQHAWGTARRVKRPPGGRRAMEEASQRLIEAGRSDSSVEGMETTLVAALENDAGLDIPSVGDSRAYLLDATGLHAITE